MASNEAESLPWEALYDSSRGFLALSRRWQIGRIVDDARNRHATRLLTPPLHMLAVLAAEGVDADPELKSLLDCIDASSLKVRLRILTSQDSIVEDVKKLGSPDVTAEHVPIDKAALFKKIEEFKPQILHLFCHGSTSFGPEVQIAARDDAAILRIGTDEFMQIRNFSEDIGLMVLNCCEGAQPMQNANSLAFSLASQGFAAVIGMRQPITSDMANKLSRAFYPSLFEEVSGCVTSTGEAVDIDWASILHSPRLTLCDGFGMPMTKAASEYKEWTLPVLYVRPEPFRVRGPATNQTISESDQLSMSAYARALEDLLNRTDLPDNVKAEIAKELARVNSTMYST